MPARIPVSIEQLAQTCEELFESHGFVKWSDVGHIYGMSRQAVHTRLKQAEERGELPPGTRERWASASSRSKLVSERATANKRLRLEMHLLPENDVWLRKQCAIRGSSRADIINGLVTRERLSNN